MRRAISECKAFQKDYCRMMYWCEKHPDKTPKNWKHLGIGLQNMWVVCNDYIKVLKNRDILMNWYLERENVKKR